MTSRTLLHNALILLGFWVAHRSAFAAEGGAAPAPQTETVSPAPQVQTPAVVSTTPSALATDDTSERSAAPDLAQANEQAAAPSTAAPLVRHWYGGETLAIDGIALSSVFAGAAVDAPAIAGVGALTYVLGGPLVHVAHGRLDAAGASLALRLVLPFALASLGSALDQCSPSNDSDACGAVGPAFGLMLGLGAAISLDSAVLAREDVPTTAVPRVGLRLSPIVAIDAKRTFLGVGGAF